MPSWGIHVCNSHVHLLAPLFNSDDAALPALLDPGFVHTLASYLALPDSVIKHTTQSFRAFQHKDTNINQIPLSIVVPQLARLTPELRYLVEYYDKAVCPSMVIYDGPTNPYRSHILQLAFEDEALMEAVYALASSHLQQKRRREQPAERGSRTLPFSSGSSSRSSASPQTPPQYIAAGHSLGNSTNNIISSALRHKNAAIKLLNDQLSNTSRVVTDSAMATLLVICVYHVCETGIGQFRTHFAGVKKLVEMRGVGVGLDVGEETGKWGWMETVFTWMDNLSATVNNREAQLGGEYVEMVAGTKGEWGLESLVGCERGLFKMLAGLPGINMLSQQTLVRESGLGLGKFEGDERKEFWREWNVLRNDLAMWEPADQYAPTSLRQNSTNSTYEYYSPSGLGFDTAPASPVTPTTSTRPSFLHDVAAQEIHRFHASNVYRYAAILYLHRLAYPDLPSDHYIFQDVVRDIIFHLGGVPSSAPLAKALVWPVFVTGAECVGEEDRKVVKERCESMWRDGGFWNKVVGGKVLEEVWKEEDAGVGRKGGLRWGRVVGREMGEVLVM